MQLVGHAFHGGILGRGEWFEPVKGRQVIGQLVLGAHAGEDDVHVFVAAHPAQGPRSIGGVRAQGMQRGGGVCWQGCQRAALDGLHDDERHAAFLGELVAPVAADLLGAVIPVEVVVLQLTEVPGLVPEDELEACGVVVAGKTEVSDAACGLLLPQPVYDAHGLGLFIPGLVQRVQQIEVDVVHAQPPELFLKNALGIVQTFAGPQRHLGGKVEAAAVPFGDHPPDKRLTLAIVIRVGRVKVIDAGRFGGVQQRFGPGFINGAVGIGGKAHTPKTQQGSARAILAPVAIFHGSYLLSEQV